MRGQARFLLTGLGTLVPIAAFTVPTFRRQLLDALRDNSPDARLNSLAEQGGTIANDLAAGTPVTRARGHHRPGLLPSLLLGALLGGGATLLYLSRKNAEPQDGAQSLSSPRQAQAQHTGPPAQVPALSGAVKEAVVTMVGQAQEILSEARDTISEQTSPSTGEGGDEQHAALTSMPGAEAQPTVSVGETTPNQVMPVAAPSDTAGQPRPTPAATPATSNRESDAVRASLSPDEEMAAVPEQQSASITPPTASADKSTAESTGKTDAATPQAIAKAANDAAAPTAELVARIKERMPVLDSKGMRVGAIDRVEAGGSIKLAKDGQGKPHWLPLRWVTRVDTHVHLGRTAQQVRREWKTSAPRAH